MTCLVRRTRLRWNSIARRLIIKIFLLLTVGSAGVNIRAGGYGQIFAIIKQKLFFDGLIDKTEAINRLRYEKPNLQIKR